jgi:hypothetical protein
MKRLNCSTSPWNWGATLLSLAVLAGCGVTKSQQATEQLLMSDAVDRAVSQIDFRSISGARVYLDTTYLRNAKGTQFVNADYIISSLRQQMVAANCLLQDDPETADVVVEARVGALGLDAHDVTYGIPASSSLTSAASLVPAARPVPVLPEISLAKKNDQRSAAKIGVFAYDRRTKTAIWQSGISLALSDASDMWVFGAGPFQRGSIYKAPRFAGSRIQVPLLAQTPPPRRGLVPYAEEHVFWPPPPPAAGPSEAIVEAGRGGGPNVPMAGPARGPARAANAAGRTPPGPPHAARGAAEFGADENSGTERR